ncbi:MAG: glycosyltransferase family 2 protein [Acholeplasmatales bacterium]|nr:glycosyltransferase family 2 protein [Acholeplasmatales bacterium]
MLYLLDIIIPIYNTPEEYLVRALNSINRQKGVDFKSINIIIIDDASKKIRYKKSWFKQRFPKLKITYLVNKENVGPGVARQNAIDAGNGKYITFLDSDDEFVGEYSIGKIISFMEEYNLFKVSTSINEEVYVQKELMNIKHNNLTLQSLHALYLRRDFLSKNNIKFNDRLRRYEDLYYICLVNSIAGENQAFIDEITYNWKWNENSLMRNTGQEYPDLDDQIYAITEAHKVLSEKKLLNSRYFVSDMTLIYLIINSNIMDISTYKNFKDKFAEIFNKQIEDNIEIFEKVNNDFIEECISRNYNSLCSSYPWIEIRCNSNDFINSIKITYNNK